MKRLTGVKFITVSIVLLILVVSAVLVVNAMGGGFQVNWFSIDGGGGASSGGDYAIGGNVGQVDAGTLTGGDYTVSGGIWAGSVNTGYAIYLPSIRKG